jgi:1-pyrroline-5-carboxylate dehydrogenase
VDAITFPPAPVNEPNLTYAPGSPEREALFVELDKLERREKDLKAHIGGRRKNGSGPEMTVVQPHDHQHVLGRFKAATQADARAAIKAAGEAAPGWRALDMDDRCAVLLRAAELLAGPWRQRINAATMLGQSKTAFQAEIDAACELIDFWRYNVHYAKQILTDQPIANSPGIWNRTDHRPLEGFVYAITPFNFTAIAGNLPTAPVLMGNTVIWKPAPTQQLAASLTMELLEEAGLPPGVINMLPGHGIPVSEVALAHPDLAGIHFTGSTAIFHHLWRTIGENISTYRSYPRIVGETGGKDFVLAHPSADPDVVRTALIRGAFEYQGQKCSAASRAYVAKSVWTKMKDSFLGEVESLPMGDVTDFSNFVGAVIDDRAFAKHKAAIARAKRQAKLDVVVGGQTDDKVGWFVRPTVVVSSDPTDAMFSTEYFGPILAVYVYDDGDFEKVAHQLEGFAPYALTGAIIACDRRAIAWAQEELRFAAGNFYINDKPTGAVVGQQPFGGDLASVDQGDARPADRPSLSLHGLTIWCHTVRHEPGPDRDAHGRAAPLREGTHAAAGVRALRRARLRDRDAPPA